MNPEPLDHLLKKRDSFRHAWALLNPDSQRFGHLYNQCMQEWNRKTYREQQQWYVFVDSKIKRGEIVHDNPLYAIIYIHPHPYDWNKKSGIEYMFKHFKMDSAFFNGHYGVYTKQEADIYEMTNRTPMNY